MTDSKVVLVTGAARGIGLATGRLFNDAGWQVVLLDCDKTELDRAGIATPGALAIHCDIAQPEQVSDAFDLIADKFGRLDALVNNAGVADFGPLPQTSFARWRAVMATNLDGTFLCSQAATNLLIASRGAIVNIASISGLRASTLRVAYGTSKAAIIHLTKQQAAELGEHGVRVNCVSPGPVATKLASEVHSADIVSAYHDAIPLNRYGAEQEIANLIVFLCSEQASYITGQAIAADGGFDATGIGLPALRDSGD